MAQHLFKHSNSSIPVLWLISLFFFQISPVAQAQSFSPGQSIVTAGSPPTISTATFSLGFAPSPRGSDLFNLGIWYRADTQQFLVWDTASPASPRGSTLELSSGTLAVRDAQSRGTTWTANVTSSATSGELEDSGNLVLRNSSNQVVWNSFDHPRGTLLPGQFLTARGGLSSGSYLLSMDPSGNLTLRWNSIAYWSSATATGNSSSNPTIAVVDVNGVLNLNSTAMVRQFFPEDYGPGFVRRLTLDDDGNLRSYTLTPPAVWSAQWQAVSDQCQVYSYCGNYGICSHRAVPPGADSTSCDCPAGLAFVDSNQPRSGCTNTGNVAADCAAANNRLVASNFTVLLDSGSTVTSNSNSEQCQSNCRGDSSCFSCLVPNDGSGRCIQFRSTSISGYSSPALQSTTFLKVCDSAANSPPTSPPVSPTRSSNQGRAVGIAVGVTIAGILLAELAVGWAAYRWRYGKRAEKAARHAILDYAAGAPIRFTYKELQNATYNFQTKIGEGGFGAVYKGSIALPVHKTVIAVKKLEGIFQGEKEFRTEMATIGSTHHMNLMRLVGFCAEGSDTRLLVYEFMPNGSLDRFLFHHDHDFFQDPSGWRDDSMAFSSGVASSGLLSRSGLLPASIDQGAGQEPGLSKSGRQPRPIDGAGESARSGHGAAIPARSIDISRGEGLETARSGDTLLSSGTRSTATTRTRTSGGGGGEDDLEMERAPSLDWPARFKVALGTARALAYLHEECREPIVHCDLKPENILLDESFSPKVSDFGLARLIHEGNTRNLTTVRGTRGYLAPEWLANLPVTAKSDVYSYGIVLFELVGGRRSFDSCRAVPRDRRRYPAFLYRELEAGRLEEAVDEQLHRADLDGVQLERMVKVAFWCIQDAASARPAMSKVVQMLEGNLEVSFPPPPKAAAETSTTTSLSTFSVTNSSGMSSLSSRLDSGR